MPELPEVETICRGLSKELVGRRVDNARVHDARLRERVDARTLVEAVRGRRIASLRRRAKYLIVELEGSSGILFHLGMSGRLFLRDATAPLENHAHVVFALDDGRELRFQDPRRFGLVAVIDLAAVDKDRRLAELGVEPLSPAFTGELLHSASRGLRRPVKNLLMDAREVVGIGNIYASEALFLAGVRPRRVAGRLSRADYGRIAQSVRDVLRAAIRQGGTTLRDYRDADGNSGYFQVHLHVYGREDQSCLVCGALIRKLVLAGRSSFFCPRCQR